MIFVVLEYISFESDPMNIGSTTIKTGPAPKPISLQQNKTKLPVFKSVPAKDVRRKEETLLLQSVCSDYSFYSCIIKIRMTT